MWFPSKDNQNQFKGHYTFEKWNGISGVAKKSNTYGWYRTFLILW